MLELNTSGIIMNILKKLFLAAIISGSFLLANAQKIPKQCTLISGTIIQLPGKPVFKFNPAKNYSNTGYPMTHTQFFIKDANGETYKVVVDNLYYRNITLAQLSSLRDVGIISDFSQNYPLGSSVEACGKVFKSNGKLGIHFVHPSGCNQNSFNGFLRINGTDIANNENYCGGCACKVSN